MNVGECAGQKFSFGVIHDQLRPHRSRCNVDCTRNCLDFGHKRLAGPLRHCQPRHRSGFDERRVRLRHGNVESQSPRIRHHEQSRPRRTTRIDQRTNIGVARCHDAVEWRHDAFELRHALQALDVGLGRFDLRTLAREIGRLLV